MDEEWHENEKWFVELEYQTLRKEIEDAKSRLFRIMTGGVLILPAAGLVAQLRPETSTLVMLLLPLVISAFMYLFLAQNRTVMRAGTYIKLEIEKKYLQQHRGWEHWLEGEPVPESKSRRWLRRRARRHCHRKADRATKRAFLFLYAIFYLASASMAVLMVWPLTAGDVGAVRGNDFLVALLRSLRGRSQLWVAAGLAGFYFVVLVWSVVEVSQNTTSHTAHQIDA